MKEPLCHRCNEPVTKSQRGGAIKMAGRIWHFECPRDARERAWDEILNWYSREDL